MTKKRNLLLVSLFLVFGLAAMAPNAMAQAQLVFTAGAISYLGRAEGKAEGAGQVTLAAYNTGTLGAGSSFDIVYTAPNAALNTALIRDLGTVWLECSGPTTTGFTAGCPGVGPVTLIKTTYPKDTVHIPITSDISFSGGGSMLAVNVRIRAHQVGPGTVNATVNANFVGSSPLPKLLNPGLILPVLWIQNEPALSVQYGSEGTTIEGEVNVQTCNGVTAPDDRFVVNVGEAFSPALTSEDYEKLLDPGMSPGDVTNGSIITVTMHDIPSNLVVDALPPVPCNKPAIPGECTGGTLAVDTPGTTEFTGPGTATFEYVVTSIDNYGPENTNLPFKISSGPLGKHALPRMTVSVSIRPNQAPAIPRFVKSAENAPRLPVVKFTGCK